MNLNELKIFGFIFFIVGCAMIINSFMKKNKCTENVEGKVIDISKKWTNDETTFYPIFEYTVNGNTYVQQLRVGSRPCKYHIGQNVELYFNPEKPEQFYDKNSNISGIVGGMIFAIIGIIIIFVA